MLQFVGLADTDHTSGHTHACSQVFMVTHTVSESFCTQEGNSEPPSLMLTGEISQSVSCKSINCNHMEVEAK